MARSSLICGSTGEAPKPSATRGRRPEAEELHAAGPELLEPGLIGTVRRRREVAGKQRDFRAAIETAAIQAFARKRRSGDAGEPAARSAHLDLPRRADGGERGGLHRGAGKQRPVDGTLHQPLENCLEPVVARMVDVVGLGRGEQDAVDPLAENGGEPAIRAGTETIQDRPQRPLKVGNRGISRIHRAEHIDQHDLPVQLGKMIAEERLHHMRLIGLEAPLHHGAQRTARHVSTRRQIERHEGNGGGTLQLARHEHPPRRDRRQQIAVLPAPAEIGGEQFGAAHRGLLVLGRFRIEPAEKGMPVAGRGLTLRRAADGHRLRRPFGVTELQQRQVQQPFAWIVDDVEMQC